MFLANFCRAAVGLVVSISFAAVAGGTSSTQEVKLTCPTGAVQKSRSGSTFCVKAAGSSKGEPQLHGPYVDFHSTGQKQSEGQYHDGARSGRWTFWDVNGVKSGETNFSGGDYHGERTQYFANGKPRMIEQYTKGRRDGLVQEYSEDGKLIRQVQYKDDRQVSVK